MATTNPDRGRQAGSLSLQEELSTISTTMRLETYFAAAPPDTQTTLCRPVHARGIGLHSGQHVTLAIHPAPANHGIVFRRVDISPSITIPALAEAVSATHFCTSLTKNHVTVGTVEHLMATFAGMGIDNALVEVDGCEIPIFDGSATAFVFLLEVGGIQYLEAPRRVLRIVQPFSFHAPDDRSLHAVPAEGLSLQVAVDFTHPAFAQGKSLAVRISPTTFTKELSRARTFGFVDDLEKLKRDDLIQGASLDCAVLLDAGGIVNADGLRCPDELVRHKTLDLLGDLSLCGMAIEGRIMAVKPGHSINNAFLRALLAESSAYEITTSEPLLETNPRTASGRLLGT